MNKFITKIKWIKKANRGDRGDRRIDYVAQQTKGLRGPNKGMLPLMEVTRKHPSKQIIASFDRCCMVVNFP